MINEGSYAHTQFNPNPRQSLFFRQDLEYRNDRHPGRGIRIPSPNNGPLQAQEDIREAPRPYRVIRQNQPVMPLDPSLGETKQGNLDTQQEVILIDKVICFT